MISAAAYTPGLSAKLKRRALQALGELPPFSPILSKLLATLANDEASFGMLGSLIEKDTVVAGNVLNLANSAVYARSSKINSVRHAISVLGVNKLRNVVLGMSVARMWKSVRMPWGWSMSRFNSHSGGTAILSDLLVQHLDVDYPEGAFVAGLLHDLGHLLLAWSLPDEYQEMRDRNLAGTAWADCEREILEFTHADLSAEALIVWNFPEPIVEAVRSHHKSTPGLSLGKVIGAADRYTNSVGLSIYPQTEAADITALLALGLDPKLVEALIGDLADECQAMMQFLQ